jgi:hypothetical protein
MLHQNYADELRPREMLGSEDCEGNSKEHVPNTINLSNPIALDSSLRTAKNPRARNTTPAAHGQNINGEGTKRRTALVTGVTEPATTIEHPISRNRKEENIHGTAN